MRRSNPTRSEQQIIEIIAARMGSPRVNLAGHLGIGDDATPLPAVRTSSSFVISTDSFLEGSHFIASMHPAQAVGYKCLARAASDLAAMGALPSCFFLNLALPASRTRGWLDQFLTGLRRASRRYNLPLVGGDTSAFARVAIAITVVGQTSRVPPVLRIGAKSGDLIFVSGALGAAQLGLEFLQFKKRLPRNPPPFLQRHLYPDPRLKLGRWLSVNRFASAMIDTSDGLSTDLAHLCNASAVGAIVQSSLLPAVRISSPLPAALRKRLSHQTLALHGGEDYELLFTVPVRHARNIPASFEGVSLTCIGQITSNRRILLESQGKFKRLQPRGWDHFSRR